MKTSSLLPGRRFLLWLGLIALAAGLLRFGVCWELRAQPAVITPGSGTDMGTYKGIAEGILRGDRPSSFYYQPFYYAVFLPLALLVAGGSVWGPLLVQCLLGAATVWFTGLVAARLAGRRAGLMAAGLMAVAKYQILCTPFLLLEVLQGFWLALLVWLALRAWDRDRARDWLWAGLCLAAAILTRGSALLLLPGLLGLLVWRRWPRNEKGPAVAGDQVGNPLLRKGGSQTLRQTFLCLLRIPQAAPQSPSCPVVQELPAESVKRHKSFGKGFGEHPFPKGWPQHLSLAGQPARKIWLLVVLLCVVVWLPQLPFSLANWQHHGRWTGPSTAQDAVLALGNTPEAPPGGLEYTTTFQEWMRQSDRPAAERVPVSRQMLKWLAAEPLAWPELKLRMFLLFWDPLEIPNNFVPERDCAASNLAQLPFLLDFGVIGALGLTGLLAVLGRCRRSPRTAFLVYAAAAGVAGVVLFYILARFRVPLLPLLAVFAGLALERVLRLAEGWLGRRPTPRAWRAVRFLLLLVFAYAFCLYGYSAYARWLEAPLTAWVRPHGVQLVTEHGALIHDHGSLALGGWQCLPLPPGGLRLIKTYDVTPAAAGTNRQAGIELLVMAPKGGQLRLTARFQGRPAVCNVNGPLDLPIRASDRPQPLRLALGAFDPAWKKVRVEFELAPAGTAPVFLFVDARRRYGRTAMIGPDGVLNDQIPLEACPELFLLPATPPAK